MAKKPYDVLIVGRGPVGLAAAAFAEQLGLSTVIVERHRDLYALPRAGHVDHEIVRLFQSVKIAEDLLEDSYPTTEYVWVNAQHETLLAFDWGAKGISGYHSDYMQFQPVFESALARRIDASAHVTQFLGWEVQDLVDHGADVSVTLARTKMMAGAARPIATDEKQTLRAKYVIAADGAGSGIRTKLGIERDDLGFNEKWLVVDARKKRDLHFAFDCGQICDPKRPTTVLPLGKRHRRWEWALLPGETSAEMEKPETAWRLLAEQNIFPADVEIVRQLVYTFEARHAKPWRRGRIFLAGDAAHTMPPFMGQGMCSGLRDAKNLIWKIDLVLRDIADESLLDTYEAERSPHSKDWSVISLEAGKIPCTLDPDEALRRDERFRNGWLPPMPDFPKLTDGVLSKNAEEKPIGAAGTLSLQANVGKAGAVALFDEFYPATAFSIVSVAGSPSAVLSDSQLATLKRIGTHLVHVGQNGKADVTDVDGAYADYMKSIGAEAVIYRPDFYVFGTATILTDLPKLVDELFERLRILARSELGGMKAATKVGSVV